MLLPLTGILIVLWLLSRKLAFGKLIGFIWIMILGLILFSGIARWLDPKTILDRKDYYGEYVINSDYFPGKQTDRQYNHFRFKITDNDLIYLYVTESNKILKTYTGKIKTTNPNLYQSQRLIIEMQQPTHYILNSNPTTYRGSWNF